MSFFRELVRRLGPGWLVKDRLPDNAPVEQKEVDSRVLWAISLIMDAQLQRLRDGILARYPGPAGAKPGTPGAPDDALSLIGRDRLIRRGPIEPADHYVARMNGYLDYHHVRGNAWAMLGQVQGILAPRAVKVALVNEHGNFYTIDEDGTRRRDKYSAWDWDGSLLTDAWARFWVIVYSEDGTPFQPGPTWGSASLWGGAWGTPGYTWGSTATPEDVFGVHQVIVDSMMAGSRCVSVVLSFDDSDFDPAAAAPPLPDGTWGPEYKLVAGVQVPNRNPDGRYWKGTGP